MKSQDDQELNNIKEWRTRLGLTQDQAAFLLGMTRPGYQYRERRADEITYETQYALLYLVEHPEVVADRMKNFVLKR